MGTLLADVANPELQQVKRIYLLSMGNGLDQHLASRLTRHGRFEVVTDPKLADAVLTDKVGEPFERRFEELYPPPPVVKEEKKDKDKDKDSSPTLIKEKETRSSSFGRGRGNVFLVDRKTRKVIWAYYKRPKDTTPNSMDRLADKIADQLRKDSVPPTKP
jgi:transposase